MKLLLDSNILLWAVYDPEKLSPKAQNLLEEKSHELLVSHASLWELLAKIGRGRLLLAGTSVDEAFARFQEFGVIFLPIEVEHILEAARLPHHHSDPFDRVIIAQAKQLHVPVVTSDAMFSSYSIDVLW